MSDSLATELKLDIARYLQEDKSTLQALSSVSKAWQAPAQNALFSALDFDLGDEEEKSISDLIGFLQVTPHVANSILRLHILGDSELGISERLALSDVFVLVSLIPGLRALTLDHCKIPNPSVPPVLEDAAYPKRPVELTLSYIWASPVVFHIIITRLTGSSLSLSDLSIIEPDGSPVIEPPFPTDVLCSVRSLDLGCHELFSPATGRDDTVPRWPNIPSLAPTTLTRFGTACGLTTPSHLDNLNGILQTKCKHVVDLRLDFNTGTDIEDEASHNFCMCVISPAILLGS